MSATNYHNAVTECTALGARMCNHVDMMELCGEMNPFEGHSSGMYGDKATNDDWHGTWNRNWCDTNNDGPHVGNLVSMDYACCRYGELGSGAQVTDADCGDGNWDPSTGKWHGAGEFPKETMKYYRWVFKGELVRGPARAPSSPAVRLHRARGRTRIRARRVRRRGSRTTATTPATSSSP